MGNYSAWSDAVNFTTFNNKIPPLKQRQFIYPKDNDPSYSDGRQASLSEDGLWLLVVNDFAPNSFGNKWMYKFNTSLGIYQYHSELVVDYSVDPNIQGCMFQGESAITSAGNRLVIGGWVRYPGTNGNWATFYKAFCTFILQNNVWVQESIILLNDPADDGSGEAQVLNISKDGSVITAYSHHGDGNAMLYIYRLVGGSWTRETILRKSDVWDFGINHVLSSDGNTLVIMSAGNRQFVDSNCYFYLYKYDAGTWTIHQTGSSVLPSGSTQILHVSLTEDQSILAISYCTKTMIYNRLPDGTYDAGVQLDFPVQSTYCTVANLGLALDGSYLTFIRDGNDPAANTAYIYKNISGVFTLVETIPGFQNIIKTSFANKDCVTLILNKTQYDTSSYLAMYVAG